MNLTLQNLHQTDNEARVLDTDLAEWLGFERPYAIRQLITRNIGELAVSGSLPTRRGQSRGQHFTAYYLNEGQALLICALARTPKAAEVRHALITVFLEYRRAQLPPLPAQHPERIVHVTAHRRAPSGWHIEQRRLAARQEAAVGAFGRLIASWADYLAVADSSQAGAVLPVLKTFLPA